MARTKKELKDQDPLLGSETADQTAGTGADGTGLVPGGEPGAPTPSDLELAEGAPLDPNAPQTETGQEPEGGQPPRLTWNPAQNRLAWASRPLFPRLAWNLPEMGRWSPAEPRNFPKLTWNY